MREELEERASQAEDEKAVRESQVPFPPCLLLIILNPLALSVCAILCGDGRRGRGEGSMQGVKK